jgi:hypothetical protein
VVTFTSASGKLAIAKSLIGKLPQMSERTSALSQDEAIRLFRFFEGNGSRDKQQMISLTTWLLPFAFGLIAC